jgi:ATP-binding cassette subfamily B protein
MKASPPCGAAPAPGLAPRPPAARALWRVLGLLVRQDPGDAAAVFALSALPGAAAGLSVLAARALFARIGALSPAAPLAPVLWAAVAYVALLLAGDVLPVATGIPTLLLNEHLQAAVERLFLVSVSRLPLRALEDPAVQDVVDRVRGVLRSGRLLRAGRRLIFLPRTVITAVGLALGLAALNPLLAVAVVAAGLPTLVQRLRLGPFFYVLAAHRGRAERFLGYLRSLLTDRAAAAEVRAFGFGPSLGARWQQTQAALWRERWQVARRRLMGQVAAHVAGTGAVGYGLGFAWVLALTLGGHLPVASCAAALTGLWAFQDAFRYAVIDIGSAQTEGLALADLVAVVDAPSLERPGSGLQFPTPLRQGITLRDVTFTYPGQSRPAIEGVSLHLPAGQTVALVGENGSGKTTLSRLVLGLLPPDRGEVLVDGVPLQAIAPASLRAHAAAVFQHPLRLPLTLGENIGAGQRRAGRQGIQAAATRSGLDPLLAELPQGLDTWCDPARPGGVELSGGQWQRVALARLAMRPAAQFLVLDEPTAALDPAAEAEVLADLLAAVRGRTALIVSHRLGLARHCDHVVVLVAGRVAEEGTHGQLVARGGAYADLWAAQAQWYR